MKLEIIIKVSLRTRFPYNLICSLILSFPSILSCHSWVLFISYSFFYLHLSFWFLPFPILTRHFIALMLITKLLAVGPVVRISFVWSLWPPASSCRSLYTMVEQQAWWSRLCEDTSCADVPELSHFWQCLYAGQHSWDRDKTVVAMWWTSCHWCIVWLHKDKQFIHLWRRTKKLDMGDLWAKSYDI